METTLRMRFTKRDAIEMEQGISYFGVFLYKNSESDFKLIQKDQGLTEVLTERKLRAATFYINGSFGIYKSI